MSPERLPGRWQPHAFSASSQRPAMPRPRPPPAKSQAEDHLERAAEMFRTPASTAGSSKPAAPSSASVADLQKTTAPKTPPKHPGPQNVQRPPATIPTISVDDEQMFQATQRSSYEQLREQISQRAKGRSAVDFYEEGMTPLLSYMFFVLHYHENYLTTENMHQWPIIPHSKMRHYTDRFVFSRQFSLPASKIFKDDVEEVLRFLLTRFGPADRPFLPVIPIGQREIVTLARSVIASKIPYREMLQHDAKAFAVPQEAMHVWELPVEHMPGPEPQANCFYCWGHGTTAEGLVGILTIGRVLRSSAEAVQVAPHDDVFSFYGKATQDAHYQPSMLDFISKLHHGTQNSAGVGVGGFMGTPHHKSKSSSTVHEGHLCKFHALVHSPSGDKRWAVREAASQAHKAATFETGDGNDWGVSWPGIEDAIRKPKALGPSEVKRGSLSSFGFVIQWYRIHCIEPCDKNRGVCFS